MSAQGMPLNMLTHILHKQCKLHHCILKLLEKHVTYTIFNCCDNKINWLCNLGNFCVYCFYSQVGIFNERFTCTTSSPED